MNNILKSAANLIFSLLALIFVIIVSLGVGLDFSQLKTAAFWLEVFIKWVLTMVIFNIVAEYDSTQRAHNKKGRFYLAFATLSIRIKLIHRGKRYDELTAALQKKNDDRLKELWTKRIHKACTHLCYDDIYSNSMPAEELALKVRLTNKRKIKRLAKLCDQIRSGAEFKYFRLFPYKPIKEEYFLKDNELSKISTDEFAYSHGKATFQRNISKSFSFLLVSIITAVITYSFYAPNFWSELVANLLTLLSAMVAGFTSSYKDIRKRTQVYENRNNFIERYLNIKDEWSENYVFPELPPVPLSPKVKTYEENGATIALYNDKGASRPIYRPTETNETQPQTDGIREL